MININVNINVNLNIDFLQSQVQNQTSDKGHEPASAPRSAPPKPKMERGEVKERLNHNKNGKRQPWDKKKDRSLKLSKVLHKLGEHKKANRVWWCGDTLAFEVDEETGKKEFKTAQFCRERVCIMCSWRKSVKMFYELSRVMDRVQKDQPDLKPIFLTLTVRNCTAEELPEMMDRITKGWQRIDAHRRTRSFAKGWFRAIEVTYDGDKIITAERYNRSEKTREYYDKQGLGVGDINPNYDTYHPHIHALIMVDKLYFSSKKYMHTTDWVRLWRISCKFDYDPICWVREVRSDAPKRYKKVKDVIADQAKRDIDKAKAYLEVTKYTIKDTDYLLDDEEKTVEVVGVLSKSLKGRRLFAYGGILKKINKLLKEEDAKENIEEDAEIREEIAEALTVYKWDFGLSDYFRDPRL